MKKSLLILAVRIAIEKMPLHPQQKRWMHYSFVVQNNKIIEWATNTSKDPPVHYGYKTKNKSKNYRPKTHSETEAHKKARGLLDKRKLFEMINIRLNRRGELRLSKPCSCCYPLLKELGCSRFYFSSEIGFLSIS